MKHRSIKIAVGILIGISLFVSTTAAACICPHHQPKPEKETASCHGHAAEPAPEQRVQANEPEGRKPSYSQGECCCIQRAPRAISKSEKVKADDKAPASSPKPAINTVVVRISAIRGNVDAPIYLHNSFHNLTPGRAPPRS